MKAQEETRTTVPSVVLEEGSGRGREAEEGMLIDCTENGLMQTHQASRTRRAPSAVSSGDSFD